MGIGLTSGRRLVLKGVPGGDREFLRDVLTRAATREVGNGGASELENPCPHCHRAVEGSPGRCARCLQRFKRPWLASLLSLLVPGLCSAYLGYRGFAALELLAATGLWLAYVVGAVLSGSPDVRRAVGSEWVFLALHGADALWSGYVAREAIFPA